VQKSKAKTAAKAPRKPATTSKTKAPGKKVTQKTLKPKANPKPTASKKRTKSAGDDEASHTERRELGDESQLSSTPPNPVAKGKKSTAPKSSTAKPLSNVENESFGLDGAAGDKTKQGDSSERYQQVR
jgi:DNA topoisomerase-2